MAKRTLSYFDFRFLLDCLGSFLGGIAFQQHRKYPTKWPEKDVHNESQQKHCTPGVMITKLSHVFDALDGNRVVRVQTARTTGVG